MGTKIVWRGLPPDDLVMWPLPVVSSTRTLSPAPMWRVSPSLAVIEIPPRQADDILPARRPVPAVLVVRGGLAEYDGDRRQAFRHLAGARLLDPVDLDVAEMQLAIRILVQIVNTHRSTLPQVLAVTLIL